MSLSHCWVPPKRCRDAGREKIGSAVYIVFRLLTRKAIHFWSQATKKKQG